jgi:hypothetical protein
LGSKPRSTRLDRFDLLILDDLAYVTKDQAETSVPFELISARYERRSMLITANQPRSRCSHRSGTRRYARVGALSVFSPAEARRLVERFEWHYTPKHGSWLDMAESELGVLSTQCLDRRIPNKPKLIEEVAAWQESRPRRAFREVSIASNVSGDSRRLIRSSSRIALGFAGLFML